jgi:hypothetical protein
MYLSPANNAKLRWTADSKMSSWMNTIPFDEGYCLAANKTNGERVIDTKSPSKLDTNFVSFTALPPRRPNEKEQNVHLAEHEFTLMYPFPMNRVERGRTTENKSLP